jgi:plastocyanin domain-containing protein
MVATKKVSNIFLLIEITFTRAGAVAFTCNQECEAGGSQVQGQPGLYSKTLSQNKNKNKQKTKITFTVEVIAKSRGKLSRAQEKLIMLQALIPKILVYL